MENITRRENDIVYAEPVDFPTEVRGLGCFFYEACMKNLDKVFQVDGETGRSETYSTILQKCVRTAIEMRKMGLKEGDVITICSVNTMDSVIPVIAASFLNVMFANIDPSMSWRDCTYLLNMVRPKIIFVEESAVEMVENICNQLTCSPSVVVMGTTTKYLPFHHFLNEKIGENEFKPVAVKDPDCTIALFFSSGTTGMAKPIKCSHRGLLTNIYALKKLQVQPNVCTHVSSFYWISAYLFTLMVTECGGYKVVISRFDPKMITSLIEKYKITLLFLASNFAYQLTKENTAGYDTSSLENFYLGGSILTEEQLKKCQTYFPSALVSIAYGQTEASGYVSAFSKAKTLHLAKKHRGSIGLPIPGLTMKIVDPETEEILPPNSAGEIRLRSYTNALFVGYFNVDASDTFDSDGFLKTGDIGYLNEDNCLFITTRIKEMFKYQSWHIVPASVEKIIYEHPAVKEAAVIGIPHPADGDHPMAVIILKEEYSNVNEDDLIDFVNARVLDREKLRAGVKIVTDFPRTITGKVIRKELRQAAIDGRL